MEDSQLFNFEVKSKIHDYNVKFENHNLLLNKFADGDAIIVDKMIYETYLINGKFKNTILIIVESKEESKEYSIITQYIDKLIGGGFRRENKIYSIGGGVIQDISGFIASILYRGVEWIFYPTTLLAQGDSCIGGKSSINFRKHKNQIGGFYPPHQIIIDVDFLNSLPTNQTISGLGEILHYFMIEGGEALEFFIKNYKSNLDGVISRSLVIKKKMIELDEFDKGPRLVFNYGHTFGHAIESITNYGVPHGIAVAHGMDMANYVSWKLGLSNEETYLISKSLLKYFWGGVDIKNIMDEFYNSNDYFLDKFIKILKKDKKNSSTHLGLILFTKPGNVFKKEVIPNNNFKDILLEYSKQK